MAERKDPKVPAVSPAATTKKIKPVKKKSRGK